MAPRRCKSGYHKSSRDKRKCVKNPKRKGSKRGSKRKGSRKGSKKTKKSICTMFKLKKGCVDAPMCSWRKKKGCAMKKGTKKSHDNKRAKLFKEMMSKKLVPVNNKVYPM